jgi:hypothetical protein
VRNLERRVAAVCRKVARRAAEGGTSGSSREPQDAASDCSVRRRSCSTSPRAPARSASRTASPGPRAAARCSRSRRR